jgi:hypothetical protein
VAIGLAAVLGGVALGLVALTLARRARSAERRRAVRLRVVAGLLLITTAAVGVGVARALASDHGGYDPIWNGSAERIALLALVTLLWLVVELYAADGSAWVGKTGTEQPRPWDALRAEREANGG